MSQVTRMSSLGGRTIAPKSSTNRRGQEVETIEFEGKTFQRVAGSEYENPSTTIASFPLRSKETWLKFFTADIPGIIEGPDDNGEEGILAFTAVTLDGKQAYIGVRSKGQVVALQTLKNPTVLITETLDLETMSVRRWYNISEPNSNVIYNKKKASDAMGW